MVQADVYTLKALRRDFPDVPMFFLETVYDFVTNHPERAEAIMNGTEEVPPPKPRDTDGGKCIEYKDENEMKRLEQIGRVQMVVEGTGA